MYFYLIISHLNYSFIFVFDPPPYTSITGHGEVWELIARRGRVTHNINNTSEHSGGSRCLLFPPF